MTWAWISALARIHPGVKVEQAMTVHAFLTMAVCDHLSVAHVPIREGCGSHDLP